MLLPLLKEYLDNRMKEVELISLERKLVLDKISNYISSRLSEKKKAELIYVCTHNSRRSHFGQLWAEAVASYFNINNTYSYSGGTEATAFNPNALRAAVKAGFIIETEKSGNNPLYKVSYDDTKPAMKIFSKKYDDAANPTEVFCAVMTCTEADSACPIIEGALLRIACAYEDPKKYDGTDLQDKMYEERSAQIARETMYVFQNI